MKNGNTIEHPSGAEIIAAGTAALIKESGHRGAAEILAHNLLSALLALNCSGVTINVRGKGVIAVQAYATSLEGVTWH